MKDKNMTSQKKAEALLCKAVALLQDIAEQRHRYGTSGASYEVTTIGNDLFLHHPRGSQYHRLAIVLTGHGTMSYCVCDKHAVGFLIDYNKISADAAEALIEHFEPIVSGMYATIKKRRDASEHTFKKYMEDTICELVIK